MLTKEIKEFFKDKKVLITGGTGLVGRQLLKLLVPISKEVHSISLDDIQPEEGVHYRKGNLLCPYFTDDMIEGKDVVFSCIGIKGNPKVTSEKALTIFENFLLFNTNILKACRRNNVLRTVYVSTIGAYSPNDVLSEEDICKGEPMDRYAGWAKRMGELWIEAYKKEYNLKNFIAVRPSNIYGPGDNFDPDNAMVIPSLIHKIRQYHINQTTVEVWGNGTPERDFVYSEDVARGMIQAAFFIPDIPSEIHYLNLGSGYGTSIHTLVDTLYELVGGFSYKYLIDKPSGVPKRILNIALARELINYNSTTSLWEGLQKTWEWYTQNEKEYLNRKNYFNENS
ncbi:MAG: NAD-dependent epimerase/dehydratase family protein [Novosphingobium sp.]|nr:NAD-dependent epimerase/dehydratase family protein [Novosphingobium sp.]